MKANIPTFNNFNIGSIDHFGDIWIQKLLKWSIFGTRYSAISFVFHDFSVFDSNVSFMNQPLHGFQIVGAVLNQKEPMN